ncbi:hypothetical protein GOP47_0003644 [Adiantum capillus-veneris]|uniref:Uncharacterized protein n=1 Tax=Adiantum capillus-veneris TaxID=13818 RepID=A0A9D4V606_ADICA|nr:hypothetical protein GOP47_0003644 [Adiantum capillus-veneris]
MVSTEQGSPTTTTSLPHQQIQFNLHASKADSAANENIDLHQLHQNHSKSKQERAKRGPSPHSMVCPSATMGDISATIRHPPWTRIEKRGEKQLHQLLDSPPDTPVLATKATSCCSKPSNLPTSAPCWLHELPLRASLSILATLLMHMIVKFKIL